MSTRTKNGLVRPATCQTCPFRGGFHLYRTRRQEIYETCNDGGTFHCHSEVNYDDDDEDWEEQYDTSKARQCAGAVTVMLREETDNMAMRLEQMSGKTLVQDPAVPFQDWEEWIREPELSDPRGSSGTGEPCHIVGAECLHPAGWMNGGVTTNYAADAEHWCSECGEATCSECMSTEDRCQDCAEEDY